MSETKKNSTAIGAFVVAIVGIVIAFWQLAT